MKSISLYEEKNTIVHKIDPLNKILYIIAAIAIPFILNNRLSAILFIGCSLITVIVAKIIRKTIPMLAFSFFILITVVIIQGLFYHKNNIILFKIGSLEFYREGLLFALKIASNVINILLCFAILVLTTKPSDLIESLVKIGLSAKIGYVLSSVFQIIPQMTATMETITDAQRSRGMETEGKLMVRIKAFFPLISPVVMNSLISTKERAIALEVRGFNSKEKKTFINDKPISRNNLILRYSIIMLMVLAIVWRIIV